MNYSPVKKGLVVTCLLLIIGLIFLPSLSADESSSGNTLIYDDIEIKIRAGIKEKTNEKRLIPICLRRKKNGKKVYG